MFGIKYIAILNYRDFPGHLDEILSRIETYAVVTVRHLTLQKTFLRTFLLIKCFYFDDVSADVIYVHAGGNFEISLDDEWLLENCNVKYT